MPIDLAGARARIARAFAAVTSFVAFGALAQTAPAPAVTVTNGAMQFRNVTVVAAPGRTSSVAVPENGFRAYIDPASGLLAEPSPEDVETLNLKLPPDYRKPPTKVLSRYRLANGMLGVRLDERYFDFSVVRRAERGTLESTSVAGEDLARQLVRESLPRSVDDGSR